MLYRQLDNSYLRAYNVRIMPTIDATLTTSGNSAAVRLPKDLLRMSGLSGKGRVRLEAKRGKIIISKSVNAREGWTDQIKTLLKIEKEPTREFSDMAAASNDGLGSLPWDGLSFEEWQKTNDKVS